MGLTVVARLASLSEAEITAGALRACGIRAEVFDAVYGQTYWPAQLALGGFRVVAPDQEAVDAREILNAIKTSHRPSQDKPKRESPVLPVWRRWAAAVLILAMS